METSRFAELVEQCETEDAGCFDQFGIGRGRIRGTIVYLWMESDPVTTKVRLISARKTDADRETCPYRDIS